MLRGDELSGLEWRDDAVPDPREHVAAHWDEMRTTAEQILAARRDRHGRRRGAQREATRALIEHALDPNDETRARLARILDRLS